MDIEELEDILMVAISEAYPYHSSTSYLEDYQKASNALECLVDMVKNNITNTQEKVIDSESDGIREILKVPECYVDRVPYCDKCGIELERTNFNLLSNPPKIGYKCNKCGKEFYIDERKVGGYWKWKN